MSARQRNACGLATLALGVVLPLLLNGAPARALSAPTPWDGVNPFDCTIQDAGRERRCPIPARIRLPISASSTTRARSMATRAFTALNIGPRVVPSGS
jgi:hypothetical protein